MRLTADGNFLAGVDVAECDDAEGEAVGEEGGVCTGQLSVLFCNTYSSREVNLLWVACMIDPLAVQKLQVSPHAPRSLGGKVVAYRNVRKQSAVHHPLQIQLKSI